MKKFNLPPSEIEAADALIKSFKASGLSIDDFDRAKLVKSGAVVTLPPIFNIEKLTKPGLMRKTQLFIAGLFASTRNYSTPKESLPEDVLFLDSPPGTEL